MIQFKDIWKGHGTERKFETQRILILKKRIISLNTFREISVFGSERVSVLASWDTRTFFLLAKNGLEDTPWSDKPRL